MTMMISVFGLVARFAGALLDTTLGWASTLLFGRVPRSHQIFVVMMLAGSLLWLFLIVAALAPGVPDLMLDLTPHPPFIERSLIHAAVLVGIVIVPLGIGLAGYLVPADGKRPGGLGALVEVARGFVLAPVLGGLMLFLPAVGISRKARSVRHRWSDIHIPIVAKPGGYDRIVADLQHALSLSGLLVEAKDAPAVLSLPAWILTRVAGPNVAKLRADRLVELVGTDLRVGIYPSDVAISGPSLERGRARAAIISRLATTAAHLTTSAEAQAVEDRLDRLAGRRAGGIGGDRSELQAEFAAIDQTLLDLPVPAEEWDILYRLRLQIERDILTEVDPGTPLPLTEAIDRTATVGRASVAIPFAGEVSP